jgi:hypothetical protein
LGRKLPRIPLCEGAAIEVGFSTKTKAEEVANDNDPETGKIDDIILGLMKGMKS